MISKRNGLYKEDNLNVVADHNWDSMSNNTSSSFKYYTKNRGIDLIYYPFKMQLRINVRYTKMRPESSIVKLLCQGYNEVDDADDISMNYTDMVGQSFIHNSEVYIVKSINTDTTFECVKCFDSSSSTNITLSSEYVTRKVEEYLSL